MPGSENDRWRRLADRLEARAVPGEAERVLRREQAQARADEHELLGRVTIPPPPGHENDPPMSLDEQLADPAVRAHLGLPPCGCTPQGES